MVEYTDEELLVMLANGNSKAMQQIYSMCYSSTEKMVFKLGGTRDDAFDVFQDSITILYEKAKARSLDLSCKLNTYVTAIAKHIWLRKQQQNKRIFIANYDIGESENGMNIADDVKEFDIKELNATLLSASLKLLGEPCSKIISAYYIQNKSMQWIVDEYGYTNTDNAKTQKYKCLNRLRKIFFDQKENEVQHERSK
jgi:RNA polymerase sigma factor (sigma-70 family)